MRYDGVEAYADWKARAREKLAELLGFPFAVCADAMTITAEKEFPTYQHVDFTFQSEENYFVPCSILIPHGEPKPIAICLQGHSTGMHISFGEEKFEDSIIPFHHCSCNYIPGIRKYFEMGDLAGLMADRTLVMVCGVKNPDFPLAGVIKSYERARNTFRICGREERCILVKGSEGHQFYPDLAWPIANRFFLDQ